MNCERITSRKSQIVRDAAALLTGSDARLRAGLYLLEGARLSADAAKSGVGIVRCFFTAEAREKYGEYLDAVLAVCESAYEIEPHIAPLLSDTKHPQGIFCVCKMRDAAELSAPESTHVLVLENVQDPSNMGNVLRTAEALGVLDLVLVGACCDLFAPKVLRGSMGAVFRVRARRFETAADGIEHLNVLGYQSLAAVPDSTARPVTEIPFEAGKWAMWVGNEGAGLTEAAISKCAMRVTVPMRGRAESLNASTAAALLLWEMVRGGAANG